MAPGEDARLELCITSRCPLQVFKAHDGYVTIAAGNDKLWQSCSNALDCANLLKEPDFATTSLRARNQEDLKLRLEAALARQSNAEVIELLDKAGVPCSPINSFAEVLEDPQIEHLGLVNSSSFERHRHANGRIADPAQRDEHGRPSQTAGTRGDTAEILRDLPLREAGTMETDLVVRRNGALKRLTLSRPGKRNALSGDLVDALSAEIEASKSDGTGVLSIEGAGLNFSAGFDFSESGGLSDGDIALRFIRIRTAPLQHSHASFATLAFAHGATFGAAADLFAACQLRYAAPGTTFRMPGLSFGVALGTRRLARLVGAIGLARSCSTQDPLRRRKPSSGVSSAIFVTGRISTGPSIGLRAPSPSTTMHEARFSASSLPGTRTKISRNSFGRSRDRDSGPATGLLGQIQPRTGNRHGDREMTNWAPFRQFVQP